MNTWRRLSAWQVVLHVHVHISLATCTSPTMYSSQFWMFSEKMQSNWHWSFWLHVSESLTMSQGNKKIHWSSPGWIFLSDMFKADGLHFSQLLCITCVFARQEVGYHSPILLQRSPTSCKGKQDMEMTGRQFEGQDLPETERSDVECSILLVVSMEPLFNLFLTLFQKEKPLLQFSLMSCQNLYLVWCCDFSKQVWLEKKKMEIAAHGRHQQTWLTVLSWSDVSVWGNRYKNRLRQRWRLSTKKMRKFF